MVERIMGFLSVWLNKAPLGVKLLAFSGSFVAIVQFVDAHRHRHHIIWQIPGVSVMLFSAGLTLSFLAGIGLFFGRRWGLGLCAAHLGVSIVSYAVHIRFLAVDTLLQPLIIGALIFLYLIFWPASKRTFFGAESR